MANRFFSPNQQFADATGAPYAGGFLYFYASGTSTPLNTYSDSALTIPNTNPVVLDSAGRAGNVFLQNLAYKVILQDANAIQIWADDPVYSSDYSTVAQFNSGNGSPNGSVAGTAGSPGIPASVYWDDVNFILYVCTTTGTAITAVWTAVNASTAAAVVLPPQGYLTLTSGTPVIPSDVTGATSLFYTPYVGTLIPIYNGASFVPTTFSELTMTLTSSQALNTIYDLFVFSNSGVPTLVSGPAWSTSTAGSGARGTGASTTQLTRLNGIWVNAVQISGRNGSTTYTIPASLATYVGSMNIDGTAGQLSCYRSWGQSRKWGLWNTYNRAPIYLAIGDSTASWTYASGTIRESNGSTVNIGTSFCGLAECVVAADFRQVTQNASASGLTDGIGIGYNSTTASSGVFGFGSHAGSVVASVSSQYAAPPSLGINNFVCLEASGSNTTTFFGTQTNMQMLISYYG